MPCDDDTIRDFASQFVQDEVFRSDRQRQVTADLKGTCIATIHRVRNRRIVQYVRGDIVSLPSS
jgi:hypothetical protein